jgi:hypothetical protein
VRKKVWLVLIALFGWTWAVGAQVLQPSNLVPVADGQVQANEYSLRATYSGMVLSASLSQDGTTLYLALEAPTKGWVSIGLGSLRMDGAFMVLAYDAEGKTVISEQTGKGHGHKPNPSTLLTAGAVKENGASTVLEIAVGARKFISGNTIKLLISYGNKDDLTTKHARYAQVELPVK